MERGPPVAATTAVTSAVSSRQISQAIRTGLATGVNMARAPEVTTTASRDSARMLRLAPGMSSSGSMGPSVSSSAATPSRARPKPRSSLFESTSFIHRRVPRSLLDERDHLEDRQVHRDDDAADRYAQEDDHHGLQQRDEGRHRGVDLVVVKV